MSEESHSRMTDGSVENPERLLSLDALRGVIMVTLISHGLGFLQTAKKLGHWPEPGDESFPAHLWNTLAFHSSHPDWNSQFYLLGVSYWDLIQVGFMFMVGVAMPYSFASRRARGHSEGKLILHAAWRALILISLGVFLQTRASLESSNLFTNVLTQIGLGYFLIYFLLGRKPKIQMTIGIAVLLGYWALQISWPVPDPLPPKAAESIVNLSTPDAVSKHFSRDVNVGADLDRWLLNLFPREKEFIANGGGYVTLNFIPSAITMLMGVMAGQLLRGRRSESEKLRTLLLGGAICIGVAVIASFTICPAVKKIWTPGWTLFSGAWLLWILAGFYFVVDMAGWKRWTWPFVIVGLNPLAAYMMSMLFKSWVEDRMDVYFGDGLAASAYAPTWYALGGLIFYWLICLYLHRRGWYIRV